MVVCLLDTERIWEGCHFRTWPLHTTFLRETRVFSLEEMAVSNDNIRNYKKCFCVQKLGGPHKMGIWHINKNMTFSESSLFPVDNYPLFLSMYGCRGFSLLHDISLYVHALFSFFIYPSTYRHFL